jgi:hypothetical protein
MLSVWILWLGLISPAWAAVPTTFEPVIGGALLCRDAIDPVYFKDYLTQYFKKPYKVEGGAYWFKPQPKQQLFGLELVDMFVSLENSRYAFLGVVFKEKLADARKKLLEGKGLAFAPYAGETVLRSALGAFLIEYNKTQTKLYCVKYRDFEGQ